MAQHVVVIGGVALGPKAACRFKRLMPEGRVTLIDQSDRISYGGCGIPFFVSGEVDQIEALQSTPYGALRDEAFFRNAKGVDVLARTRALAVDRQNKTVHVEDLASGETRVIGYDKLVLATGSKPKKLPVPGNDLGGVGTAVTLDDAERIKNTVTKGTANAAVIVGGGFIGLEMAVALADLWGIPVSVIEAAPHILPACLSPLLARMVANDMEAHGVSVYCDEKVVRLEGSSGTVVRVVTDKRTLDADLVLTATGVVPDSRLAAEAGLSCTANGLVLVDEHLRTSDPDIYSGGDVAGIRNLVTGKPVHVPLGSQANRQGRVIGTNLAGGTATFPGAAGAWGIKLFGQSASGSGLTLEEALKAGFDAMSAHIEQIDRAHFYPDHAMMALELVVEKTTRRVLGIQGVAASGDALTSRINAVTPIIASGGSASDIGNLEVVYSPPFAAAMDIVNALGNVVENTLEGRSRVVDAEEFLRLWECREQEGMYVLDTRDPVSAAPYVAANPKYWHTIPQDTLRERIAELPEDAPLVLVCNTGLRAYEAQRVLDACGRTNSRSVAGGLVAVTRAYSDII